MMFDLHIQICGTCVHNLACNGIKGHGTWHSDEPGHVAELEWLVALALTEPQDVFAHECEDRERCICCREDNDYYYDLSKDIFKDLREGVEQEAAHFHGGNHLSPCPQCPHCIALKERDGRQTVHSQQGQDVPVDGRVYQLAG